MMLTSLAGGRGEVGDMADKAARRNVPEKNDRKTPPKASRAYIVIAAMISLAALCLMLIDSGHSGG